MQKLMSIGLAILVTAAAGTANVRAGDVGSNVPAIIETTHGVAKVLLRCTADQVPVMTEGPTVEIQSGKMTRYDHGILKCADITETVRDVDGGGSGSANFTNGRKIEVVNCPKGTVPFILNMADTNHPMQITRDPRKPVPTEYIAIGPVTVRCIETALMAETS